MGGHFGLFVLASFLYASVLAKTSCKDEAGNDVDWWIIMKLPKISAADNFSWNMTTPQQDGTAYMYITPSTTTLRLSNHFLGDSGGAFYHTLNPVYKTSNLGVAMYNDEKPDSTTTSTYGHTKGVIAFDESQGFWLIHSVPRVPPQLKDGFAFRSDATIYGQSMICVTLSLPTLDQIGLQLQLTRPWFYESVMPAAIAPKVPNLAAALQGTAQTKEGASKALRLSSVNGASFIHFAKNAAWNNYIDENFIEPYLSTDMYWETWMRPAMASFCAPTYRWNSINVRTMAACGYSWKETNDHSKWAIAAHSDWVCIGDINRMESQRTRAGGMMCFSNANIHKLFAGMITSTDSCTSA